MYTSKIQDKPFYWPFCKTWHVQVGLISNTWLYRVDGGVKCLTGVCGEWINDGMWSSRQGGVHVPCAKKNTLSAFAMRHLGADISHSHQHNFAHIHHLQNIPHPHYLLNFHHFPYNQHHPLIHHVHNQRLSTLTVFSILQKSTPVPNILQQVVLHFLVIQLVGRTFLRCFSPNETLLLYFSI